MNPLSTDEQSYFARAFRFAMACDSDGLPLPTNVYRGCGEGATARDQRDVIDYYADHCSESQPERTDDQIVYDTPGGALSFYACDLYSTLFKIRDEGWTGGQWSASYRLTCGVDLSPATWLATEAEIIRLGYTGDLTDVCDRFRAYGLSHW